MCSVCAELWWKVDSSWAGRSWSTCQATSNHPWRFAEQCGRFFRVRPYWSINSTCKLPGTVWLWERFYEGPAASHYYWCDWSLASTLIKIMEVCLFVCFQFSFLCFIFLIMNECCWMLSLPHSKAFQNVHVGLVKFSSESFQKFSPRDTGAEQGIWHFWSSTFNIYNHSYFCSHFSDGNEFFHNNNWITPSGSSATSNGFVCLWKFTSSLCFFFSCLSLCWSACQFRLPT